MKSIAVMPKAFFRSVAAFIRSHKKLSIAIAAIAAIVMLVILLGGKRGTAEIVTVGRHDIVDEVRIAGRVEADIVADMGFETSGTVRTVLVSVNDRVRVGQQLMTLDFGTLSAELKSAQADLSIARVRLANLRSSLNAVEAKQDTLVENARQVMLSEDLITEPQSSLYSQTAPVITGRYSGSEGTYKLRIKRMEGNGENYELRVFDRETIEPVKISKTGPTPLGTKGLYISFPDAIESYNDTTWYVTIPNEKSSAYLANYNAYQEALAERDRALDDAEAQLRGNTSEVSIAEAEVARAEADVARIQALMGERIIRAPFNGIVTAVHADPGESIGSSEPAVSLISEGVLGVEIDLPEVDSVKVLSGDMATITLDAFGESAQFPGHVVSVNRAETLIDGIPVYEARIVFDGVDERVVSGMTAQVSIETDRKDGVLAIPARALLRENDGWYVHRFVDERRTEKTMVQTGLRGSDSFVEIVSGLSAGDRVEVASERNR